MNHIDAGLRRLELPGELGRFLTGVAAVDAIHMRHGKLFAAHRHDRHILQRLADAFAADDATARGSHDPRPRGQVMHLCDEFLKIMADGCVDHDEIAGFVFAQSGFQAFGNRVP